MRLFGRRRGDGSARRLSAGSSTRTTEFADGRLWDRQGRSWRRVSEWVEPHDVHASLAADVPWLIEWCEGDFQWASDARADVLERTVLPLLLTREQGRRELAENGDMRTVFVAERWRSEADDELLLFYESSPVPRAESWFR